MLARVSKAMPLQSYRAAICFQLVHMLCKYDGMDIKPLGLMAKPETPEH